MCTFADLRIDLKDAYTSVQDVDKYSITLRICFDVDCDNYVTVTIYLDRTEMKYLTEKLLEYAKKILELVEMIDINDKNKNNMTIAQLIAECAFFIIKRAIRIETIDIITSKICEASGDE